MSQAEYKSESKPGSSNAPLLILLGLLVVAIAALAYDYKVARPAVEDALAKVTKRNEEINASAENRAMTNEDVQSVLGRQPSKVEEHSPFTVEVYNFMSGLPFRNYPYYAVYYAGDKGSSGKLVFQKHFIFEIPAGELTALEKTVAVEPSDQPPAAGSPFSKEAVEGMIEGMKKKQEDMDKKGAESEVVSTDDKEKEATGTETKDDSAAAKEGDEPTSSREKAEPAPPTSDNEKSGDTDATEPQK